MDKTYLSTIHFNDIPVKDLEKAIAWYTKNLGLQMTFRNEDIAIFKLESGPVLIINRTQHDLRPHWKDNETIRPVIGFLTESIKEFHQELTTKQVRVTEIRDEGMGFFFEFYDLDDNYFSVVQYPSE